MPRDFELSPEQTYAKNFLNFWRSDWPRGRQVCALAGFAGTGKTTIISDLLELFPNTAVCAPTGKAANVLRQKGCEKASTIHSLIYNCDKTNGKCIFRKRQDLGNIQTVIVDEGSMVDSKAHADLCSFGIPVLYVGDHGQLEPVGDNPQLMQRPNCKLEKIHRQAENNPIIRLSRAFREGRPVPFWRDEQGRCAIVPAREFPKHILSGAQIIVGTNRTRHSINAQIRKHHGYIRVPAPGEKVICLQNNSQYQIFNGQQAIVVDTNGSSSRHVDVLLKLDDERELQVTCLRDQFGANKLENYTGKAALLDYGYAITAHKAQGSEYDSVLALEEIAGSWDRRRWAYTVCTRARNKLIWCR